MDLLTRLELVALPLTPPVEGYFPSIKPHLWRMCPTFKNVCDVSAQCPSLFTDRRIPEG